MSGRLFVECAAARVFDQFSFGVHARLSGNQKLGELAVVVATIIESYQGL